MNSWAFVAMQQQRPLGSAKLGFNRRHFKKVVDFLKLNAVLVIMEQDLNYPTFFNSGLSHIS